MKLRYSIIGLACISLPISASASVVINEIAWMGTAESTSNEWIELKNTSGSDISLDGWMLVAEGGIPLIKLAGTTTPGGFFLLERTNDESVSGAAADQIYTGALSNSGEKLVLKNVEGVVADTVDASHGWPAGNNDTKETMQRFGVEWATATPTPRAENITSVVPKASLGDTTSRMKNPVMVQQTDLGKTKTESQSAPVLAIADNVAIQKQQPSGAEKADVMNINLSWLIGSLVAGLAIGFLVLTYRSFRRPSL